MKRRSVSISREKVEEWHRQVIGFVTAISGQVERQLREKTPPEASESR
jgi:hypothetical protein